MDIQKSDTPTRTLSDESTAHTPENALSLNDAISALLGETLDEDTSTKEPDTSDDTDLVEEDEDVADDEGHTSDEDPEDDDDVEPADEEDDEDASDEEPADQPEHLFEVEGEKVTLDEARRGFLRQADYTRKAQDLADQRKAIQSERETIAQERQYYSQVLDALKKQISTSAVEPSWTPEQQEADPVGYLQAREAWRDQQDRASKIEAEQARIADEQKAASDQALQDLIEEERGKLLREIPEWADQEVATREKTEIREFMHELGFSEEEAGAVIDHRVVKALRLGLKGWQLSKGKETLVQKKAKKGPTPGLRSKAPDRAPDKRTRRQRQAERRLLKSGSIDDAVELLLAGGATQ